MTVDVKGVIADLTKHIDLEKKHVQFATRVGLTRTAMKVKAAEEREMRDVFDRPTPFTMSSLSVRPATASNPTAEVKLKDFAAKGTPATSFLAAQLKGGSRKAKRFERALLSAGALPPGYHAVPGSGAKVDAYGNMDRGQIVQILSYFNSFPEVGYKANMTDKRRQSLARGSKTKQGYSYFVGSPGDRLPLGVYQRFGFARGSAIRPVLIFVPSARYEATFDFDYVAKITIDKEFATEFTKALAEARSTAR